MVEGYDAADPERGSILALRDEWMNGGPGAQARIGGGYGALIGFLMAECRSQGAVIHLRSVVSAIEETDSGVLVRCANGDVHICDKVILTVPPPLLKEIMLPLAERKRAAAVAYIGFGNVIKILLRFETRWWADDKRRDLADLTFLLSDATIPVWWTQFPAENPLASSGGAAVLFSGEALYRGRDMGTAEAALASGLEVARTVLAAH
jgi:monoamine oxidase